MPVSLGPIMSAARRRRRALIGGVIVLVVLSLPLVLRLRVDPDVLNLLPQTGPAV